jgi:hypothetical protein
MKALRKMPNLDVGIPSPTNFYHRGSLVYEELNGISSESTKSGSCSGSPAYEWKFLREEIKLDLLSFASMERDIALQMLKDKIELRRGLRGLAPLSPRVRRLTNEERMQALKYVKGRVQDLRHARTAKMAPTKAKQAVKLQKPVKHQLTKMSERRESKLQKPTKHRLTKMAERKDVRPLRPSNNQPIANQPRAAIV